MFESRKCPLGLTLQEILQAIAGTTMLDPKKLQLLHEVALKTSELPGQIAEAGVAKGGVCYLFAATVHDKTIHAFDSWEGLPVPVEQDLWGDENTTTMHKGWGKCEPPVEFLAEFGSRVVLHQGWFENTLEQVANEQFCLVHVDCDRYEAAKECTEFFYPRMVRGGYMIYDDYGFHLTPGVKIAVDEYFSRVGTDGIEAYSWGNLVLRIK